MGWDLAADSHAAAKYLIDALQGFGRALTYQRVHRDVFVAPSDGLPVGATATRHRHIGRHGGEDVAAGPFDVDFAIEQQSSCPSPISIVTGTA